MADYDDQAVLDRKLTENEIFELRGELRKHFTTNEDVSEEDIADLLDYTFAMVSNQKTINYVIQELVGMDMDFCPEATAHKIGAALSKRIRKFQANETLPASSEEEDAPSEKGGEGRRMVSLKSHAEDKGNALTMAGALGASRKGGGKGGKQRGGSDSGSHSGNKGKGNTSDSNRRNSRDRGGRRSRDGRQNDRRDDRQDDRRRDQGGRTLVSAAFDRLVDQQRGGPRRGGQRGEDFNDRRRSGGGGRGYDDRRSSQAGRGGGRGTPGRGRDGGQGGRSRLSGSRRGRDNLEEEDDFIPAGRGTYGRGGGRGDGRHPGRRFDGNKRQRMGSDGEGGYDESYEFGGYDDGYGYQQQYPNRRGGGGGYRGGRGGRGRSGRGQEDEGHGGMPAQDEAMEAAEGGDAAGHPSPIVADAFGGRGYGFRGRGRGRSRGRGRGHFYPGREQVASMIKSKAWVRPKTEDDAKADGGEKAGDAAAAGNTPGGEKQAGVPAEAEK